VLAFNFETRLCRGGTPSLWTATVRAFLEGGDAGGVLLHAGWALSKSIVAEGSRASNKRSVSNFYRATTHGLCLQKPARPL